jgi:molybdopterin converting factor small subunit
MKVKVKTNFFGQPEIEIEMPTLRKVLLELSKKTKFSIFAPKNEEVHSDFKVYLNGVEYEALPHGIDTELKDGDKVEITMVILAGG